jgi:hypothetical protein
MPCSIRSRAPSQQSFLGPREVCSLPNAAADEFCDHETVRGIGVDQWWRDARLGGGLLQLNFALVVRA